MAFRIEDLPTLDNAGRLGRHLPADSALADAYHDATRPTVATQVASLGAALGMSAVRMLQDRFVRSDEDLRLMSHGGAAPSYTTWPDCTIYPDTDGCAEPCYGFEPHHMDTL